MKKTVLITYFEPFGGLKKNVTKDVSKTLQKCLEQYKTLRVKRKELRVEPPEKLIKQVEKTMESKEWDYVIMLGETDLDNALELKGYKRWVGFDNSKFTYKEHDPQYPSSLDINLKNPHAWSKNTNFELKHTIGDYSCSLAYYVALTYEGPEVGFFHLRRFNNTDVIEKLCRGIAESINYF